MEPGNNINGETKYIEPSHMEELSHILIQMEKVNMSGQQKIIGNHLGKETGWQIFERIAKEKIVAKGSLNLKSLDVRKCRIETHSAQKLQQALSSKVELILDNEKTRIGEDGNVTCCCVCSK